jgi:hypothetical protein
LPLGRRKKQGAVNPTNVFILFLFLKKKIAGKIGENSPYFKQESKNRHI